MRFKEKKVLVFGSGISGVSAAALLLQEGAEVVLYDGNEKLDASEIKEQIEGQADGIVSVVLGTFPEEILAKLDLVVMSPGVPTDLPVVDQMRDAGIPVWGEIELAYVLGKGDVLAITGTNGKTTTTALLGAIMKNYRESTFVVGNIGNPYTSIVPETKEDSVDRSRDEQLSVGDDSYISSEGQCDFKYYARSSEQTSYDGGLY